MISFKYFLSKTGLPQKITVISPKASVASVLGHNTGHESYNTHKELHFGRMEGVVFGTLYTLNKKKDRVKISFFVERAAMSFRYI